jgi:hypothetical protein
MLNVDGCSGLSVENSELMMKRFSRVSTLSFKDCQEPVQFALFTCMLQKLDNITLLDLRGHIAGKVIDNYPMLIVEIPLDNDSVSISEFVSARLDDKCRNMNIFVASRDTSGITFLSLGNSFRFISSLHILHNDLINDYHITSMCSYCPLLLSFHVRSCSSITSTGVVAVCFFCPDIDDVLFDGTGVQCRIGDAAMLNGLVGLKRLRNLSLFQLQFVSPVGLREVVRSCVKLNNVRITGCLNLSCDVVGDILSDKKVLNSCFFSG